MKASTTLVAMTLAVAALAACSSSTAPHSSGGTMAGDSDPSKTESSGQSNRTNTTRPSDVK